MDSIDKLVPVLILGVVATILLVLLRRTARDKPTMSVRVEAPKVSVAAEVAPKESGPPPVTIEKPIAVAVPVIERKVRRKLPLSAPVTVAPTSTIDTVLGMLHDQQALAAAFLLREVFAPPVSRRPRLPRNR